MRMGERSMRLGVIGVGNMATAILKGTLEHGFICAEDVLVYDVLPSQCSKASEALGCHIAKNNAELAAASDVVLLAVKPVYTADVLREIAPFVKGKAIISIVTGWTMDMISSGLGGEHGARLLRVMPNTPAMVGEGFSALCEEATLTPREMKWAQGLFDTLGTTAIVPERLFDAVVATSGSSPAYGYLLIEAIADGAVQQGLPRELAIRAAAQSILGAAKMVLSTGEHPAKLKDAVCSPGGTTIDAVYELEKGGMRAAIMRAMQVCAEKSSKLGKK